MSENIVTLTPSVTCERCVGLGEFVCLYPWPDHIYCTTCDGTGQVHDAAETIGVFDREAIAHLIDHALAELEEVGR